MSLCILFFQQCWPRCYNVLCFSDIFHNSSLCIADVQIFFWVMFSLYLLYMYCYHLIFSFWFQSYLIITLLLLSSLSSSSFLVIIFMPGSYNYVPGKTKVSRLYNFAAVVYQQFVQNAIKYYYCYYYYYYYPDHQQFSFLKACTLTN